MKELAQIMIIPKSPKEHREACQLIASSFRGKFQALLPAGESRIGALLAAILPNENHDAADRHMLALMNGEVVGSIGLARSGGGADADARWRMALAELRREYGWRQACKFAAGMTMLHHEPHPGEGYIDHLAVRAGYRNLGIGGRLLAWAKHYVRDCPDLRRLTLHAAGSNQRAIQLYERHGFATICEKRSWISGLIVQESRWRYMAWDVHMPEGSE